MAGTLQTLISISGAMTGQSDPVQITANPVIATQDPSLTSGGLALVGTTNKLIIPTTQGDTYLYVRNSGTGGGGTGLGLVDVTSNAGVVFATLRVGDFAFLPVKGGLGVKIKYNTADTYCVYGYFTVKV
tara:strand:+ start:654 stop:1040 length:387 start_codon:yes stop_codon:yes gene_type:complete